MSYLNLDLDDLCKEIKSLMCNNYGEKPTEKDFNEFFNLAKWEILKTFKSIIEENQEEVLNDFKEKWENE